MKKSMLMVVLGIFAFASYAQSGDELSVDVNNPIVKQLLMCEKEATDNLDYGDPQVCKKAISMIRNGTKDSDFAKFASLRKKQKTGEWVDSSSPNFDLAFKQGKHSMMCEAYFNAGVIYDLSKLHQSYSEAARIYQEALDEYACGEAYPSIELNLGILYYEGEGVYRDRFKACSLLLSASRRGEVRAGKAYNQVCR